MGKAVEAFSAAIAREQTCAAANAGLALAWCAQGELRLAPAPEAYARARDSALRALAMDDSCADAQVALGTVLFLTDWNWAGAERSLTRAIALDPDNTDAWLLYGRLLDALGRLESGCAAKHKALERSPQLGAGPPADRALLLEPAPLRRSHRVGATSTRDRCATSPRARVRT
jgi:tetratricopeptide (TPR) repeat protein